ncbi:hypothetical protein ACQKJZ_11045 [Sphingomonas sp. NPDC019816]|jgi:hypothetical protein|uniref:hypothetical protein n=1 Tax=Alphaproteobacteria TaxID=28211 RepID=UPI001F495133|nr:MULTISPECIES: hypothetical protein [Alphaproteobacteria]|tara:strand:- start:2659 stop:2886 length:228 start_codon:yes stop_codon:yes gene_type:complete
MSRRALEPKSDNMVDPYTLRVAAQIVRSRLAMLSRNPHLDGLERLGASKMLKQLAVDLEVSADHVGPKRRQSSKS